MANFDGDRIEAALIGAYVADAAALGFHWLYDPERIANLAGDDPAFRAPNYVDFDGFKGVFVHPDKVAGDVSQYGAQLRVAVQSMIATGGVFDTEDFQNRFVETFGPGGSWTGYIDKATRGTLENLAEGRHDPSGAPDDQVPAIARLPAAMAACSPDAEQIDRIVAITSVTATAKAWGPIAAALLTASYEGSSPREAALSVSRTAQGEVGAALREAIELNDDDTVAFAGQVGRACTLSQAIPVIFHICARAESYREAVNRNILAGGDNCGRAPVLGAVFAADHGLQGAGVPLSWLLKLSNGHQMSSEIELLVNSI